MEDAVLRLKMVVNAVKRLADLEGNIHSEEIGLKAVYDPKGPNALWSKWTPSGSLTFDVSNPGAFGKVLPGQFFFVDLTPADKDAV
jgi:hypothetical protein